MQPHLGLELAAPMEDAQAIQVPQIDARDPVRFSRAESEDDHFSSAPAPFGDACAAEAAVRAAAEPIPDRGTLALPARADGDRLTALHPIAEQEQFVLHGPTVVGTFSTCNPHPCPASRT